VKINRFLLLAAGLSLAMILTISCSTGGDDDGNNVKGGDNSNVNGGGNSNGNGGNNNNGNSGNNNNGNSGNTMYTLTVNTSPSGAGTVSPAQASYASGTQATVTATPVSGYTFSRWSGASTSTSNPLSITMNGDKTLTAVFEQVANAVIITLTYWETKETDGLFGTDKALDPRIYFKVIAKNGNATVSSNNTSDLLYADDVGQTWSGSKKSSPIPFVTSASELRIEAVVIERDPAFDDDISPGYYMSFSPPFRSGKSGTETLDYGNGKSKVRFNYEFVWQ
jgi:uncharacterized repeat protein (TIGR02543 family)